MTAITRFAFIAILVAGCSGDDDLTRNEAIQAYGSTAQALSAVQVTAEATAEGGSVSATATCSGGGSAAVDGAWTTAESFDLDVALDDCSESGITIDGAIHFSAAASAGAASLSLDGHVDYSGRVNGSCTVLVAAEGSLNGASVEGSICGRSFSLSASL